MTPAEKRLWDRLRNNRLEGFHFRRQQMIGGFIADYYCNPVKLVIEIDGCIHENTRERDEEREKIIKSKGIRVIRVTNGEIETDIEAVLNRILGYCREISEQAQPFLISKHLDREGIDYSSTE